MRTKRIVTLATMWLAQAGVFALLFLWGVEAGGRQEKVFVAILAGVGCATVSLVVGCIGGKRDIARGAKKKAASGRMAEP